MSSTNWERVAEIIGTAREMGPEERDAYLVTACCGDNELLDKIRSIVAGADTLSSELNFSAFPDSDFFDSSQQSATSFVNFREPDKLVGQLLEGRFRIEKNLTENGADEGGIGLVYLARDMKLLGRDVVVKILKKAALKNSEIVRKFHHEKEALIRLEHPNIVRILDSGALIDGNPFMVMEYIAGFSLRKILLKNGILPLNKVAHIIESVTSALGAAHSKKILHRDIKPENIMLTEQDDGSDHVRLIDFGIARVKEPLLAPETAVGYGAGTLRYIAPEQLGGQLDQTSAVDIYAFSIVVYEMLTGELPFKPDSSYTREAVIQMYELQKQGLKVRPSSLRQDLPPRAEAILLSGLEYDASRRPQDVRRYGRELAAALRRSSGKAAEAPTEPALFATQPSNQISESILDKRRHEETIDFAARDGFTLPTQPPRTFTKAFLAAALAVLILSALAIPMGIAYWSSSEAQVPNEHAVSNKPAKDASEGNGPNPSSATDKNAKADLVADDPPRSGENRELTYFLKIQKMRNGKPFETPFKSSGQEIFESGYKFSMLFQPDADGFMYIFNEGKDEQGNNGYYLLFPSPSVNRGSSRVLKDQQIETAQNTFTGGRGTEVMWMIWTQQKRDDLETVIGSVVVPPGAVRGEYSGLLQSFLEKARILKPEVLKDSGNQQTIVKAKGGTVVYRFELEHR